MEKIMTDKKEFIQELEKVERPGMENLLEYLEKSDFYEAPASAMYHSANPGGLLAHSLAVLDSAKKLYYSALYEDVELPEDSLTLVCLLHDICKTNTYESYFKNVKNEEGEWEQVQAYRKNVKFPMGHSAKSLFILSNYIQLTAYESQAIYWHMGAFDVSDYSTKHEMSQAFRTNKLAFILHQADMAATYLTENE